MATKTQTSSSSIGPRPAPRPTETPRLLSVGSPAFDRQRGYDRTQTLMRRVAVAALGLLAAGAVAKGVGEGFSAAQEWAARQQVGAAESAPHEGDVCVVVGQGVPRVMGDEFADGTDGILSISDGVNTVIRKNPYDRVGICRPPESNELGANYVVPGSSVRPSQEVDLEEFDALGGVSDDVTLG